MNRNLSTTTVTTIVIIVTSSLVSALAALAFLTLSNPLSAIAPAQPLAGAPNLVSYQGHLTDSNDDPINGTPKLKFGLYDAESVGTLIWEETHNDVHNDVPVTNGYFTVLLGSVTPLDASAFGDTSRWLQVSVDTGSGYNDLPRQRVASAPFALQAANADTLDGLHASTFTTTLGCRVIRTITQSIPSGPPNTLLEFNEEIYNTNNCWLPSNPTRLVAPTTGYYMAGGAVTFPADQITEAGRVTVFVVKQSGTITTYLQANGIHTVINKIATVSAATGMFHMAGGDYIEILVFHDMGAPKIILPSDATYQHRVNGWLMKIN